MKNILSKIVITFVIIAVIAIGLKVSDNILAGADALSIVQDQSNYCGTNNGYIWNGSQCVNTCDQNHPWDPYNKKCSGVGGYNYNYTQYTNTNCAVYGAGFYFNGVNCVQGIVNQNANYYGNPYNGGTQNPVYGTVNYQALANTNVYNSNVYNTGSAYYSNGYNTNYQNLNNGNVIYYNSYTNSSNNDLNNCYYSCQNHLTNGPKKTEYYIYTITTTTSQPKGTPIYLGNINNCGIYCYGNIYYNNSNDYYYNSSYSYSNQYYSSGYYNDFGVFGY